MKIDLNLLIDERNRDLWEELNKTYKITIEPSTNNEYSCYTKSSDATIYVVSNDICIDSFTHELLHVYLKYKEIYIGAGFSNIIRGSNTLIRIFSEPLLEHIGNCLDHIKMFEIYIEMGFNPEKFILDYHDHKCTSIEIADLKRYYRSGGSYNITAIDFYIGKFIAIHADFNESFDYDICLKEMKNLDQTLYNIFEQFIIAWEEFDIDNQNIIQSNYNMVLNDVYEDLKKWLSNKTFV